ncbi:Zn-ribbon domain-containing OB-fold protein [Vulcanisaeta sp. JCM 16159]|uniref:Zn-ribbon domain-containing OB-fold protein n=1 Tax=Vulcanisaeta sp. JCM 16159 TaxID=1295371 RepID=UPI0006D1661F|nr:zinc ribbon domain-containing protein [Vulcanisaeta sp. JCM 16159]
MELNELLKEYDKIYESGQIPITQCRACGYKFHMPRTKCPKCGSANLTVIGYGEGTIYSYTIIERGLPARTIVVIVDFDGAKVKANYVGELNALRIGARVRVVRKDGNIYFTNY